MRIKIFLLVFSFAVIFCTSCEFVDFESYVTTLDSLPNEIEIISAPDEVVISGELITIEAYLWRDFMPPTPPNGTPMMASLKIKTVNLTDLPAGLKAEKLYVVNQQDVWVSDFSNESRPTQPPYQMEVIARDGPKWGPGILVDVVVMLRDSQYNIYYIRIIEQNINMTS